MIENIILGDDVTGIDAYAFNECSGLSSVAIGDGVVSIVGNAFTKCVGLISISVSDENKNYTALGNCLIEISTGTLLACCKTGTIPSDGSVKAIGDNAFYGCVWLKEIVIPDGVTSIGDYAFRECSALTNISIPDSVTSVGYLAFQKCDALKYKESDNGLYLGNSANPYVVLIKAKSTSITNCSINEKCNVIYCFAFDGCSKLEEIHFEGTVSQWNDISKGNYWNNGTGSYTIHCTDGDIAK